jgi:hypothetical protein
VIIPFGGAKSTSQPTACTSEIRLGSTIFGSDSPAKNVVIRLAEAFERERMHAPQHFPIRFLFNLPHRVSVHWGSASVTREARLVEVPARSVLKFFDNVPSRTH